MFRVNIRIYISLCQTEKQLSRETEQTPSLEVLKTFQDLDKLQSNLGLYLQVASLRGR